MVNQITWTYTNGMEPANAVIVSAIRFSALCLRCSACWSSAGLRGWGSVRIDTMSSSRYRPAEAAGACGEQRLRRGRDLARRDLLALGSVLLATVKNVIAGAWARRARGQATLKRTRPGSPETGSRRISPCRTVIRSPLRYGL